MAFPLLPIAVQLAIAALPTSDAATSLSLAEAISLADKHNPDLISVSWQAQSAVHHAERTERETWWPRFSLRTGYSYTDLPAHVFMGRVNSGELSAADFALDNLTSPDAEHLWQSSATLWVPVDLAGAAAARGQAGRAGADALGHDLTEQRLALRLAVVEAYRRAYFFAQAIAVTERALAVAQGREEQIASRVSQGAALQVDLLRARTRRRQREADVAARRADSASANAHLSQLLGSTAALSSDSLEPPPPVAQLPDPLPLLLTRGLDARPLVKAARERAIQAEHTAAAEQRSYWPTAGLVAQVEDHRLVSGGGAQHGLVGATLEWALFEPTHGPAVDAAVSQARAADEQLRGTMGRVQAEVQTAYARAIAAREQHAATQGGTLDGEAALRVIQDRRSSGVATLTDELETEAAMFAAQLEELRAATEVAIADAALWRSVGSL